VFLNPTQVLSQLTFPPKPRIGDFGAGAGHYSVALAKRYGPYAEIYAFDALPNAVDALKKEMSQYASPFYSLVSDLNERIPLAENALNAGVAANILHQLSDKERFVSELGRVLAPGSPLLVVDWARSGNFMGPPPEAVLSPSEALRLFTGAGFTEGPMLPAGTHHFAFVATAPQSS
jgi:ubiquinone/menaquinone biosynthesis C-methylase UbiE